MNLLAAGLNYRSAPLELREQLAIPSRQLPETLRALRNHSTAVEEAVVLSTCNRVECYVTTPDPRTASRQLVDLLSWQSRLPTETFQSRLYRLEDREAAAHLFRVTAGLDSMVLGESEITAQIKEAYTLARTQGTAGPLLNRLFQKALHSTKLLRSKTQITQGQASIGSITVRLAEQLLGDRLPTCEILLWGAGKAAEATARHLIKRGIRQLWIVNRTQTKAQDLASLCQGGWLSWEQALRHLAHVDIAIVCTQAPHYVIDTADVEARRTSRGPRPLILIDLAVPRNIDPLVARQPGVRLYNVDDLQGIGQAALARRQQACEHCETLIQEQVGHFWRWWNVVVDKEGDRCQSVEACSLV